MTHHAVVYEVEHKQDFQGDTEAELDMLVQMSKETPGFVSGTWISDGTTGYAVLIYESAEAAQVEVDGVTTPPDDASITLRSVKVYEVKRTA
jgi:hypothetical protein